MIALRPAPRAPAAMLLLAVGALTSAARADDPEAARAAYDRGARAFEAKRYVEAASDFARADALAPNAVALGSALKSAALADDPVLGMTLADRAELRPGAGEAALAAAHALRERFATRVGKLSIRCAAVRPCSATVDADPFPVEQPRWVTAGSHAVEIAGARYTVAVGGGKALDWQEPAATANPVEPASPAAPAPAPAAAPPAPLAAAPTPVPAAPAQARGISPAWFWVGLGATAVVGGVTLWSGIDTLARHNDFENGVTNDPGAGQAAQLRTNLLIAATSAAGLATLGLGVFAVRWSSLAPVEIAPGPRGVTLRALF